MKTENITCPCGTTFDWENTFNDPKRADLYRPDKCWPCLEIEHAAEKAEAEARAERDRIEKLKSEFRESIPPRFQNTDVAHPGFNHSAWRSAHQWRPNEEKPWIGLIGETGKSKSRMQYLLAEDIFAEMVASRRRPTFFIANSQEIKEIVMTQFSSRPANNIWDDCNDPAKARQCLARIKNCDLLVIDDLGKARVTPAFADELYDIINRRHDQNLTTIWSANSTPEQIAAALPEDMAAPFAGRLVECSKIYRLK